MFNKYKIKLKAITAVESVIYLALFGLIFIAVMEFVITVRGNSQVSLEKVNMEKVIIYINNHISDSFVNSTNIDDLNSVYENDNGKIRIIKATGYKEYSLVGDEFSFNNNGNEIEILDPDYNIEKLRFDKILNNSNELKGIRMELSIVSIKNPNNIRDFHTSFLMK
jgi:hypothetical protein